MRSKFRGNSKGELRSERGSTGALGKGTASALLDGELGVEELSTILNKTAKRNVELVPILKVRWDGHLSADGGGRVLRDSKRRQKEQSGDEPERLH
jgi:hypothetical protein